MAASKKPRNVELDAGWPVAAEEELPVVSAVVLEKAKAHLKDLTDKWAGNGKSEGKPYGSGGVCMGEVWDLEGRTAQKGHTACHSWLGYQYSAIQKGDGYRSTWDADYKAGAKPFLCLNCHTKARSTASDEATDAIILWMASEKSPFSKYILNRDDPKSLTEAGAIILCGPGGASQAQAMWMCKVLRYATEGSQALDVWNELYKNGVHPVLAVLICTFISAQKGASFTAATVSSHVSVFRDASTYGGVSNAPDLHGVMKFSFNKGATCTSTVFGDEREGKPTPISTVKTKIASFCKPVMKDDGWGGKVAGESATKEDLIKRALEWQEELGGYNGASFQVPAPMPLQAPPVALPDSNTVFLEVDL
jgi:hypothetical protein